MDVSIIWLSKQPAAIKEHVDDAHDLDHKDDVGVDLEL
jgi:hypothetical protein